MSTIKTNTLQNVAGTLSVPVDTVVQGSAKAWVNFNGTGTVAIRAAFNVSSITGNGTGDYTVNFTTAMQDANYSAAISPPKNDGSTAYGFVSSSASSGQTSATLRYLTVSTGGVPSDYSNNSVAIFR